MSARHCTLTGGSSFSWQAKSTYGGFDAGFRGERRVGDQACSESDMLYSLLALQRYTSLGWLRTEAAMHALMDAA